MKVYFSCVLFFILFSCSESDSKKLKTDDEIKLKDLIPVNRIDSVEMINNYGRHKVKKGKLILFKRKLGDASLEKGSLKMGGIHFSIFIKGKRIPFTGRTHGNYLETHSDYFPNRKVKSGFLYFKINKFNLDNF